MLIGRDCLLRKQLNINPNVNFQGVEIWENHLWNLANLTDTMPRAPRIQAGDRLQSSSLQSTRCEQAECTAGLAWNRWAGALHTDSPGPQVASHFCSYHEPATSLLTTNSRTTYLLWYRWHKARNMRNISQEMLLVFQKQSGEISVQPHSSLSLAHLFNFPFKSSKKMTLRGLRNGNNLCQLPNFIFWV